MAVTEAEWIAGTDPTPLLVFLRGKASERKLRLFAVACCRRVWRQMTDGRSRRAIEVAEHYADGSSGDADRIFSSKAAWAACATPAGADPRRCVRSWRKWCDLGGMKLATMGLRFDNKGLGGPDPRVGGSGRRAWRGPRRRPAFRQCRRAAGRRGRITQQSRTNRGR